MEALPIDQQVVTRRPGFDWDARVAMMPGLPVRVHDTYLGGEGILCASLLGLFSLVNLHGAGEVAEGELMRFFAEAAWYPTALLPSQGVHWEPAADRSAYATLTEGAISITMLFTFYEEGLIETVRAEARGRTVGGKVVPTPWHARCWNYGERGGMHVAALGRGGLAAARGRKALLAQSHLRDRLWVRAVIGDCYGNARESLLVVA